MIKAPSICVLSLSFGCKRLTAVRIFRHGGANLGTDRLPWSLRRNFGGGSATYSACWHKQGETASRRSGVSGSLPPCFPGLRGRYRAREGGGGRATRQPGQVRKEAALTSSGSGRSSTSYCLLRAVSSVWREPCGAICGG